MGSSVQPQPVDPVTAYLQTYGKGGGPSTSPTPSAGADPVASYLQKYGKGSTGNIDLRQASDDTRVAPTKAKSSTPLVSAGLGESTVQGLLGGFADEIGGAGNATLNAILHPTTASANQWKGDYANYRDVARNLDQNYAQNHPVAHTLAELAGGALPAVVSGGALSGEAGAGLLARTGLGALGGAATGGVYGIGNAEGGIPQRLAAAVPSALAGGVLGAVTPLVMAGIGGIGQAIRGTGAQNRAIGMLSQALQRDQVTPDLLAQRGTEATQANAPMITADLGGQNLNGVTRWATSQPSQAKDAMITALRNRNIGQFDRIVGGANDILGNTAPNAATLREALETTRATNADQNYAVAYTNNRYSSPILDRAMESPAFARAVRVGHGISAQDDIVQELQRGGGAPPPPPTPTPPTPDPTDQGTLYRRLLELSGGNHDAAVAAMRRLGMTPPPQGPPLPAGPDAPGISIKALDFAKQYLDRGIQRGFDATSGFDHTTATVTRNLLQQVLNDVDAQVPAYGTARAAYTADSRPLNALTVGENALRTSPQALATHAQGMNPAERQALVTGTMDAVANKGANVADRSDLSAQFLANPAMQGRFQAIAPTPESYEQLIGLRNRETSMARTLQAAVGGSDTERNRILSGSMDAVTPSDIAVAPISVRRAMMRIAGRLGQRYQTARNTATADALAPYLQAEPGTEPFGALIQRLTALPHQNAQQTQVGTTLSSLLGEGVGSHAGPTR